ncbi:MAG: hypothetical protein H6Q52_2520 [Deltaproteobacteria bacterium]|nr:hypothetical protein [Deltaproteobacteria bacterium]
MVSWKIFLTGNASKIFLEANPDYDIHNNDKTHYGKVFHHNGTLTIVSRHYANITITGLYIRP